MSLSQLPTTMDDGTHPSRPSEGAPGPPQEHLDARPQCVVGGDHAAAQVHHEGGVEHEGGGGLAGEQVVHPACAWVRATAEWGRKKRKGKERKEKAGG